MEHTFKSDYFHMFMSIHSLFESRYMAKLILLTKLQLTLYLDTVHLQRGIINYYRNVITELRPSNHTGY